MHADWLTEWGTLRVWVYFMLARMGTPSSLVREREREIKREGERKQKVQACSKHSSFIQSVSMQDFYINYLDILLRCVFFILNLWKICYFMRNIETKNFEAKNFMKNDLKIFYKFHENWFYIKILIGSISDYWKLSILFFELLKFFYYLIWQWFYLFWTHQ